MAHIEINISEFEREEIIGLLEECLSDLKMEIADTDLMEFRAKLKDKKDIIQKFMDSLIKSRLTVDG